MRSKVQGSAGGDIHKPAAAQLHALDKQVNQIRSAVLMIHGENAHSCYFSKDAYADMTDSSKYLTIIIPKTDTTSFNIDICYQTVFDLY